MNLRPLTLAWLAIASGSTPLTAQTAEAKPAEVTPPALAKPAALPPAALPPAENLVIITPFRPVALPPAKSQRTFQLSKLNKTLTHETSKELQRLFSIFAQQNIVDGTAAGFSKATGYLTALEYRTLQDLGDNRFLVRANWIAAGPTNGLAAGTDLTAVLLLDHPAKAGDLGKCTAMHVGTVAVSFTANGYLPALEGKPLTLRREAFIECKTLEDSAAALQHLTASILNGAEVSVITNELIPCKNCGGAGFTREVQKGKLDDKRVTCTTCDGARTVSVSIETKIIP